jgi:hypothetical protein
MSLIKISEIPTCPQTQLYAALGAEYMYGNLPVFQQYSASLRFPLIRIRFPSVDAATTELSKIHNLNTENTLVLRDWLTHGEPIVCLTPMPEAKNSEPGAPQIPVMENDAPITGPVKLTRTTRIYYIDQKIYEKHPAISPAVYGAFYDAQL